MKRSRFSEEQIIGILKEAEAGEMPAVAVCRKHGISEQTFYRWKGLHRSVARYRHRQRDDGPIRTRLKELAGRDLFP